MIWAISYVRSVIALVLLAAAITKLRRYERFVDIIRGYQLVSTRVARWVARLLPATEGALGILLLTGRAGAFGGAAAALLFLAFCGAMTVNLVRGRSNVACGCFGPRGASTLTWRHVMLNVALATCAIVTIPGEWSAGTSVQLHGTDALSPVIGAAVTLLATRIGAITIQLLKNAPATMSTAG